MVAKLYQMLDLGSAASVFEFWLRENSEPRFKYKQEFI